MLNHTQLAGNRTSSDLDLELQIDSAYPEFSTSKTPQTRRMAYNRMLRLIADAYADCGTDAAGQDEA